MTQRCGRREDLKLSPPLSNHDPRSPARSLGCLISRIFHHLEHSWPPRRAQGLTSRRVYCFSANRRALRPAWTEAASHSSLAGERAQQGMKKPWPLSGKTKKKKNGHGEDRCFGAHTRRQNDRLGEWATGFGPWHLG